MRYCPKCNQEYVDTVTKCADDGTPLVDRAPQVQASEPLPSDDRSRLATIATTADQFEADELAQDLSDEGIDVELLPNRGPTVGVLVTQPPTLYSILVPDSQADQARALVRQWRPALEASTAAAEQAAEEEEAKTEAKQA